MKRAVICALALALLLSGCSGGVSPSPSPAPESPPPAASVLPGGIIVNTDWSALGESEGSRRPVGSRWYEDYAPELIPRGDYGALIPYAGLRLHDDWPSMSGCLYGLMTADGVAVTDPVYSDVSRALIYGWFETASLPLLILTRGESSGETGALPLRAVAASDGSWCTGFDYRYIFCGNEGLTLFSDSGMTLMSPEGEITAAYSLEDMGLSTERYAEVLTGLSWGEGPAGERAGDYIYLGYIGSGSGQVLVFDRASSAALEIPMDEWRALSDAKWEESSRLAWTSESGGGKTVLTRGEETRTIPYADSSGTAWVSGELVIFNNSGAVWTLSGQELLPGAPDRRCDYVRDSLLGSGAPGLIQVTVLSSDYANNEVKYYLEDGSPIPLLDGWSQYGTDVCWYRQMSLKGGLIELLDLDVASYYDINTLECVFRTYLSYSGD